MANKFCTRKNTDAFWPNASKRMYRRVSNTPVRMTRFGRSKYERIMRFEHAQDNVLTCFKHVWENDAFERAQDNELSRLSLSKNDTSNVSRFRGWDGAFRTMYWRRTRPREGRVSNASKRSVTDEVQEDEMATRWTTSKREEKRNETTFVARRLRQIRTSEGLTCQLIDVIRGDSTEKETGLLLNWTTSGEWSEVESPDSRAWSKRGNPRSHPAIRSEDPTWIDSQHELT